MSTVGLYADDNEILSDSLWSINYMADTDDDFQIATVAAGEVLPKVI